MTPVPDTMAVLQRRIAPPDEQGCTLWTGHHFWYGHGCVRIRNQRRAVHRVVYELTHGELPAGTHLHHTCGKPACVNVAHLMALSPSEHSLLHRRAEHEERTHCKHGHPKTPENIYLTKNGLRQCRVCNRVRAARVRALAATKGTGSSDA